MHLYWSGWCALLQGIFPTQGLNPRLSYLSALAFNIQKTKIMGSDPITSWQIDGEMMETVTDFLFWGAPKSLQMVTAATKLKDTCSLEEKL